MGHLLADIDLAQMDKDIARGYRWCGLHQVRIPVADAGEGKVESHGAPDLLSCFSCGYGHLLNCHYPETCAEHGCYDEGGENSVIATEEGLDG